jgi:predicted NACHT family NTPase
MQWVAHDPSREDTRPLPIWIDLKEYAQDRCGLLEYSESGCTTYGLNSGALQKLLLEGAAALYLDGLDEIFDGRTRGLVVEEITAFASRYAQAPVVVTSRIVGYQSDQLRNAGFIHATLEDFDETQVSAFLSKWHDEAEDQAEERKRLIGQLERALRDSRAVRELAGNPLLLTSQSRPPT